MRVNNLKKVVSKSIIKYGFGILGLIGALAQFENSASGMKKSTEVGRIPTSFVLTVSQMISQIPVNKHTSAQAAKVSSGGKVNIFAHKGEFLASHDGLETAKLSEIIDATCIMIKG